MKTKEITKRMLYDLDPFQNVAMANVSVIGYPWESDLIKVMPSYHWYEYEVKISRADFLKDFDKMTDQYYHEEKNVEKHGFLAGSFQAIDRWSYYNSDNQARHMAKPKRFYFVSPIGLLKESDIPAHAGWIEIYEGHRGRLRPIENKKAPDLKKAEKLGIRQIYNLAKKTGYKELKNGS